MGDINERGEYLKIPDGLTVMELFKRLAQSEIPANTPIVFCPDDGWTGYGAEIRFLDDRRNGTVRVEIVGTDKVDPDAPVMGSLDLGVVPGDE